MEQIIREACNRNEALLQNDPASQGESRPGGQRILFVPPVAVTYRINAKEKTVSMIQARVFRKRGK